jgi:hypothetical protein
MVTVFHDAVSIEITINSMELKPSREAVTCAATQDFLQHFMGHEGSLPCT